MSFLSLFLYWYEKWEPFVVIFNNIFYKLNNTIFSDREREIGIPPEQSLETAKAIKER